MPLRGTFQKLVRIISGFEYAYSIRNDDLTRICISIYPDTVNLERGADQMANFIPDYGLSDIMLGNFFLTGTCTKFV